MICVQCSTVCCIVLCIVVYSTSPSICALPVRTVLYLPYKHKHTDRAHQLSVQPPSPPNSVRTYPQTGTLSRHPSTPETLQETRPETQPETPPAPQLAHLRKKEKKHSPNSKGYIQYDYSTITSTVQLQYSTGSWRRRTEDGSIPRSPPVQEPCRMASLGIPRV